MHRLCAALALEQRMCEANIHVYPASGALAREQGYLQDLLGVLSQTFLPLSTLEKAPLGTFNFQWHPIE